VDQPTPTTVRAGSKAARQPLPEPEAPSTGTLRRPSGPDGKGARPEARPETRAANLSAYRRDGQARASYESSPVAMLNPSL
jgi:hypothetical protein